MTKRLVIVESPTKAKTLGRFLGEDFIVESSVGHIRDLPNGAEEIPEELKGEAWTRLGINIDENFEPLYVVNGDKKKVITDLKRKLKSVDELLLATDEDREGEAISWHLLEVLQPKCPVKRMVFHEITKEAVTHALAETRELDTHLVEAQETRRIIDRLVGYQVSPLLWKKIKPKLSAGRVQSVAVRIIVERELERMRFRSAEYWDLSARFLAGSDGKFAANLVAIDGDRLASGKDFEAETGALRESAREVRHLRREEALALQESLKGGEFQVVKTEEKPFRQRPPAPFTTSTLQQEAGRKLGFDAQRTMRAAQRLYELGFITYMRTDSVNLSKEALNATRNAVTDLYGPEFLPKEPRIHKGRVKNAQEAHEAIRPAGEVFQTPGEIGRKISADEAKVYDLIWKRTMACQMAEAVGRQMTVTIEGKADGKTFRFTANGRVIDFPGFLRAYVEGSDDPDADLADKDRNLPPMKAGDPLTAREIKAEEHHTKPPARLTEASLVKKLEESGVGRPSTYASIIRTIQAREYTFKKGQALVPTFTAFAVTQLLTRHMGNLIDLDFTAKMEDRLDTISRGELQSLPYLKEFYFGNGVVGLKGLLEQNLEAIDPRQVCSIPLPHEWEGNPVVVRVGRYGPYLEAGEGNRANLPEDICPDELGQEEVLELFRVASEGPRSLGAHPESGEPIYLKVGRFGPYVQLGDRDEDEKTKPKMSSLLPGMEPETLTLEEAVQLLSLPRIVGQTAEGEDITVTYGRYGGYLRAGSETRSLTDADHVLTVTKERCLELLAQPRQRGRRTAEPLKVFESIEALDGARVQLLKGRYGPYVTDGETNASLPKDYAEPTELTEQEATQLILDRRARVGKKKTKKKTTKKKTTKKKVTKKKVTKKKATKKKTTKKKTAKKKATKTTKASSEASAGGDFDSDVLPY